LGSFLKNTKVFRKFFEKYKSIANLELLFSTENYILILTKIGWATFWATF
jgi:hypothetical protein